MSLAPRAFNRHVFSNKSQVYYGTDDGSMDGSFGEFAAIEAHYNQVDENRKENIHMVSVIGGLYGLNLIALWKPKKITFFDINPMAIKFFNIIYNIWTTSNDAQHFLKRLSESDYEATSDDDIFLLENIAIYQNTGDIDPERGARSSNGRSFENSWLKALERFEETKKYLLEAEINIRVEPMEGENFKEMIRSKSNHWIYASNITQFHFFELEMHEPSNVVLLQIHFDNTELLDLAKYAGKPVLVKFEYPITVETI